MHLCMEAIVFGLGVRELWRQMPCVVETNAVGCGGKCLGVRGQMSLVVFANAVCCGGKCLLLWRQMQLCVEAIAFESLSLVWLYACVCMDICVRAFMSIVVGAYVFLC